MAKSSRASRVKKNNTALKNKVFGPAEQARAQRLNDKLFAIAAKPSAADLKAKAKDNADDTMDIEEPAATNDANPAEDDTMQLDNDKDAPLSKTKQKAQSKSKSSIHKKRRGKPQSQIAFKTRPKGKRGSRR